MLALATGCATVSPAPDVESLTGTWTGWIVGDRDFTPATLEIRADGTFELSGARVALVRRVTGTIAARDGGLRLDGSGGWHGTLTVSGAPARRTLRLDRDDRLYSARFVEAPRG